MNHKDKISHDGTGKFNPDASPYMGFSQKRDCDYCNSRPINIRNPCSRPYSTPSGAEGYPDPFPEYAFWQKGNDIVLVIRWTIINSQSILFATSEEATRTCLHGYHRVYGRLRLYDFGDHMGLQNGSCWRDSRGYFYLLQQDRFCEDWKIVSLNDGSFLEGGPSLMPMNTIGAIPEYHMERLLTKYNLRRIKGTLTIVA